jgi:hypothetical protein|tara:strand:+ start:453 stop:2054 length:1602 start_codon:yes stop_codon:yes gene_type:complete
MRPETYFADFKRAIASGDSKLLFAASLAACGILFLLLGWATFSEDDAHVMRVAIESGWLDPYYNGDIYKQLSAANFTPVVLTLFHAVLILLPLDSASFLVVSSVFMAFFIGLAGVFAREISGSSRGAWLAMVLVFSNLAVATLVSRFYTMHYIVGGVFALLALILSIRKSSSTPQLSVCALLVCALLAKEVYVGVPPIVLLIAWRTSNLKLAISAMTAIFVYFCMRLLVLGLPSGGGSGSGYLASVFSISGQSWAAFFEWYLETKWLVLLAALAAFFYSPLKFIKLLPLPLLFLLPTFLAAHGYLVPELHGDRIFFAFDSAVAIAAAIILAPLLSEKGYVAKIGLPACLIGGLFLHVQYIGHYRAEEQSTADYKVTQYLMDSENIIDNKTFFVPLYFDQGELMIVEKALNNRTFLATQNCILALQAPVERLVVFDQSGNIGNREGLEASCRAADRALEVLIAPRVIKGVVEWDLDIKPGFAGGVLFVDRAIAIPAPSFSMLMVAPADGERYQLFAYKENQWWFSEIAAMEIQK